MSTGMNNEQYLLGKLAEEAQKLLEQIQKMLRKNEGDEQW